MFIWCFIIPNDNLSFIDYKVSMLIWIEEYQNDRCDEPPNTGQNKKAYISYKHSTTELF